MSAQTAAPSPAQAGSATPSTTAYAPSQGSAMAASGTLASSSDLQPNGNGEGESSKMGAVDADPTYHALNLTSYIFNVGFLGQNWADVQVTFFGTALQLHRIILARSPYLAHLMMNTAPGSTVYLTHPDDNITPEAIHICLQHLYSPAQALLTPHNARAVLATAFLLQGMPELVQHAYVIARDAITAENVLEYVQWADRDSQPNGHGHRHGAAASAAAGGDGTSWAEEGYAKYGEWTIRLKQDILYFLMHELPSSANSSPSASPTLLNIYSHLPFPLFKQCLESAELPISSMQDRFAFAKKVVAMRKKVPAASGGMEESVVLAFKGGEGMEVVVTRKGKKGRPALWKVEG